jgi:metallophosphoesterase (TIGR00282 family)
LGLDWVIVNAENAASGFGLTPDICEELFSVGVDVITTGNHIWDQRSILEYIGREPRVLRPANYPAGTPGNGYCVLEKSGKGKKLLVINVMTRLFMDTLDDPFAQIEQILSKYTLQERGLGAIFLDVHGEASSEKQAIAHMVDGRTSAVVGTHTHVPTADAHILPKGTGYQTDAGMCGDYNSVIGFEPAMAITRFRTKMPSGRLTPAMGEATLCGVYYEINDKTGLCDKIAPLRLGGRLRPEWPV